MTLTATNPETTEFEAVCEACHGNNLSYSTHDDGEEYTWCWHCKAIVETISRAVFVGEFDWPEVDQAELPFVATKEAA